MSESIQEAGRKLIAEGERILQREVQGALREQDFNLAVRRAQEAVELALKGALKVLGVDYPRVHDVAPVFSEQLRQKRGPTGARELERIEEVSLWLAQARAPAFYLEREYRSEDAQQASQDAGFVVEAVKSLLSLTGQEREEGPIDRGEDSPEEGRDTTAGSA